MYPKYWTTRLVSRIAVGLVVTGALACAKPVPPDSLVKAEQAYGAAVSDPKVSENAPVYLHEAKQSLDEAQALWRADDEDPRVEHQAYLAHKWVEIARHLATKRVADEEARALARERDKTVLEARSRQVDLARVEAERARKAQVEAERRLEELQAKKTDRGMVITLGDVLFDFNRAELRAGAQQNLYRLVTFLRENSEREVLIEGHTDSVGSDDYNRSLSQRRAEAVREFLATNGISAGRTAVMGYGESRPVSSNETDAGRQQNRRVEVVILDPGKRASEEIGR